MGNTHVIFRAEKILFRELLFTINLKILIKDLSSNSLWLFMPFILWLFLEGHVNIECLHPSLSTANPFVVTNPIIIRMMDVAGTGRNFNL